MQVLAVSEDEHGVRHLVDGPLVAGETVAGHIDWVRRFDHMQQHSGQHILSRIFVELYRAATVGFHLGARESTIDLDRADLSDEQLDTVERRVNELIFRNISITGTIHSAEAYEEMRRDSAGPAIVSRFSGGGSTVGEDGGTAGDRQPDGAEGGTNGGNDIRSRLPRGAGQIRVVEIEGLDRATCCGTHCRATGEIGLVKILGTERVRRQTRVRFICGGRAAGDYSSKHGLLQELARSFSTDWRELGTIVPRLAKEHRELSKQCDTLRGRLAGSMRSEIAAPTGVVGRYELVKRIVILEDGVSLKDIVMGAREGEGKVVLFGVATGSAGLAFACSPDVPINVGEMMKSCIAMIGGRGGGGRDFAQGGGGDPARVQGALDEAERLVRAKLET